MEGGNNCRPQNRLACFGVHFPEVEETTRFAFLRVYRTAAAAAAGLENRMYGQSRVDARRIIHQQPELLQMGKLQEILL